MSRSRRKEPFSGIAYADSEKKDKRIANRAERRINKRLLADDDNNILKKKREVSNIWDFSKDGKIRIDPRISPKDMRK